MTTSEERIRILNMVQEGKISATDGAQLLSAIDNTPQQPAAPKTPDASVPSDKTGRWFHVKIMDTQNDKQQVNVRLPVSLIRVGMRMGAKFSPEVEKLDVDELIQIINSGEIGQLVDVFDEEDGKHIQVYIE